MGTDPIISDENGQTQPYKLAPSLPIGSIAQLALELSSLSATSIPVTIDASATESLSTAAAQLLLALGNALDGDGSRLMMRDPSPALCQSMRLLGLETHLQYWTTA